MAALGALTVLAGCPGSTEPPPHDRSSAAAPRAGSFTRARGPVGEPCGLQASAEDLWVLACSGTVFRIPKLAGVGVGAGSAQDMGGEVLSLDGLVHGSATSLWALVSKRTRSARKGMLVEIRLPSGDQRTVGVGSSVPMSAASATGRLWVGMLDGRLLEVDGRSVRAVATGEPLLWVTADRAGLWTIAEDGTAALRDPAGGSVRSAFERIIPEPIAAAAAFGSLWAASPSRLLRVDPVSRVGRDLGVDGPVNDIEPCGETVWVSQPDFGVRSMRPDGTITASVALDVASRYLACDGKVLWVLAEDGSLGSILIAP